MDDITSKIQSILNDEESMKQLNELADMLSSGMPSGGASADNGGQTGMPDLSALFGSIGGGQSGDESPSSSSSSSSDGGLFGDMDIGTIMNIMSAVSSADTDSREASLILALKPYLSEKRRKKADKAVKMLKLLAIYTALREQGVLNGFSL